jgi:broad specificity phosphatase PhoE
VTVYPQRILLVRHGQTDWNKDGRWQGVLPIGLNSEGHDQAQRLAQHLRDRPIAHIVSSDLPRAFETAQAIAAVHGLSVQPDERWREFNLGIFQALTRDEIIERYPTEWETFRTQYWDYVLPSGESRSILRQRVYEAFESLAASNLGPEVVAVSHGGALKTLLITLFESDPSLQNTHLENTSVTVVERRSNVWHLAQLAAIPHL